MTNASDRDSLTFEAFGGATLECTARLTAVHSTDDPDQPRLEWTLGLGGDEPCRDRFETFTTVTYRDEGGTTRTTESFAEAVTTGSIQGAYTGPP